jgi:LacI family transcriptional regulator
MALRGMGRAPPATRAKIERTASELGYIRDIDLSRLMSRARRSLHPASREPLVFLSEQPLDARVAPAYRWLEHLFLAARETAHLLGYELEAIPVPPGPAAQRNVGRMLYARGVRGILVGPITTWSPATLTLDWRHFAAVELGSTLQSPALHRVERDYYDDLLDVYARLYAVGYRRIGLALSPQRLEFMHHMPEATLLFSQQCHPDLQGVTPLCAAPSWNARECAGWLEIQRPDVVLVYEPDVPEWLGKAGIRVPRDLGLVYLDSKGGSQTGLVPDTQLLAHEAVHLLVRMVEGGAWGIPRRARLHRFRNLYNPGKTIRGKPSPSRPMSA